MNPPHIIPWRRYRSFTLALLALMVSVTLFPVAAHGEEAPLIVDADAVQFDESGMLVEASGNVRLSYRGLRLSADFVQFYLRSEVFTAQGHVVLVDAQGREFRGELLTYDVRAQYVEATVAEITVDGVHIRSRRIQRSPDRILADESSFTTCNPDRPALKFTAGRIEVYPGDRIVAHQASLWVGGWRALSVPVYTVSLRDPAETARSFPRLGYSDGYGLWVDYRFFFPFGDTRRSHLRAVLGTRTSGLELNLELLEAQIGTLPFVATLTAGAGWFHQGDPLLESTRTYYGWGVSTLPIRLGPATTWQAGVTYEDATYGTGDRQSVLTTTSVVTHELSDRSLLRLTYDLVEVLGATPFLFDAVDLEDRVHEISLQFEQNTLRTPEITTVTLGTSYDFRDQTTSVNAGYGERRATSYHWALGTEYNLTTRVTRLSPDVGVALGSDTYVTVQAVYNTSTSLFEDLDYILTARACGCIDISVKYRQVRQEIWLEVGLSTFPGGRLSPEPGP